ncbi:MAG: PAS domain S-box protein [bacterium]
MSSISNPSSAQDSVLFRSLLDKSSNAIFIIEPETGQLLDVNEQACESLGYSRDELIEKTVLDITPSMNSDLSWHEHLTRLRQEESMTLNSRQQRKNGTTFPVRANLDLIEDDGRESAGGCTQSGAVGTGGCSR